MLMGRQDLLVDISNCEHYRKYINTLRNVVTQPDEYMNVGR